MADVKMCDSCEEIYAVDEMNVMEETLEAYYGEEFTAIDDVCDACLEVIFEEDEVPHYHSYYVLVPELEE
jgi:hypothetical protein